MIVFRGVLLFLLLSSGFCLTNRAYTGPAVIYLPYAFTNLVGIPGEPGTADGAANDARFLYPASIAVDGKGVLYVADRNWTNQTAAIRRVTPEKLVTTIASGFAGFPGSSGDYGAGPGVAVDSAGTVYVADSGHHCIRKLDSNGGVETIAGRFGEPGSNDGPATDAKFYGPTGIAIAPDDTIYISDSWNFTVRQISPKRFVTTLAGSPGESGVADGTGLEARFGWIRGGSMHAQGPRGIAVAPSGDLFVVDSVNLILRRITPPGRVTTYAGFPRVPVFGWDGTGAEARFGTGLSGEGIFDIFGPIGLAVDSQAKLYVVDTPNGAIRRVAPGALVTTIAGYGRGAGSADGVGPKAGFASPEGIAVDQAGNLYVADTYNNRITKGTQAFLELTETTFENGRNLSFELSGPFAVPVIIQSSEDLKQWISIKTNSPPDRNFTIQLPPGERLQFMRALYSGGELIIPAVAPRGF